jgi:DDE superfamily endonuclease
LIKLTIPLERADAVQGQANRRRELRCLYRVPQTVAGGSHAQGFPDCRSRSGASGKKDQALVETLGGRLRLFFLPPYSPDRNPDELVWKYLKAATVGRTVVTDKVDFKRTMISAMRSLQKNPAKICSFFQKPSLQYAARTRNYFWTDQ